MSNRIETLKEIMDLEKQYALEEIDSETFEKKMIIYEKQLHETSNIPEDELRQAITAREIPLSAESLVEKISIEDLLPTFSVPKTFYRHLKIRREIRELERNITNLTHNIQKMKILYAEKKVSAEAITNKIETLEFDLRLAENRRGAREKYLKRNPSKGELLKFTLENFLKFSYGRGVANETDLKRVSEELVGEIKIRKEYKKALVEILATMKTSQIDVSTSRKNGLPDFKQLIEYQQEINELYDYLLILTNDINDYSNCLSLIYRENLKIDDSLNMFTQEKFGIEIQENNEIDIIDEKKRQIEPLLRTLQIDQNIDDNLNLFLIETTDSTIIEKDQDEIISNEIVKDFTIPETSPPIYYPRISLEIIGMEDFGLPFNISETSNRMSEPTQQIIFQSFEGMLTKLIDSEVKVEVKETKQKQIEKAELTIKPELKKPQVSFSSLSEDIKKGGKIKPKKEVEENIPRTNSLESPKEEIIIVDNITPTPPTDFSIQENSDMAEEIAISEDQILTSDDIEENEFETKPLVKNEITTTNEVIPSKEEKYEKISEKKVFEEDTIKPQKTSMFTPKLLEAAIEAWKLIGKALFNLITEEKRDFIGYLQEAIVFGDNRLGFIVVSEETANQTIIDKIFDQIKPLWITEELLESAEKRKLYVIREVVEALQVQKDVALHISKLQEFTNFRNINYPIDEQLSPPEIIGILPIEKIRIKRGTIISSPDDILPPQPYRTAPWDGNLIIENQTPIEKNCHLSYGMKIGKVLAVINHPLMGKLLLIDREEPDYSLVDYLVNRLNIDEKKHKERIWLVKYLIAKQLKIPEGESLKPKTLIDYSIKRNFPILPNEILNSYRTFVSGGSVEKITKNKVILKNSVRIFHPAEIFPLECLRVRTMHGRHIGTCLGLSLSNKPVILVSEKLSRDIVSLFSNATVEKDIMTDISQSVIGTIGVDLKDSLCVQNILKSLIVSRKILTITEYGKFLSKMNVTGIDLSDIQVVEKGTIYVKSTEIGTKNIFADQ